MLLMKLGQEQVAEATEDQMAVDRRVFADLEVVHAQFHLAVLEHAFDLRPAEGDR